MLLPDGKKLWTFWEKKIILNYSAVGLKSVEVSSRSPRYRTLQLSVISVVKFYLTFLVPMATDINDYCVEILFFLPMLQIRIRKDPKFLLHVIIIRSQIWIGVPEDYSAKKKSVA